MKSFVTILAIICLCEARPSLDVPHASAYDDSVESRIIGGIDAQEGAWPHQLSQERLGATTGVWSHSCGASLLSSRYALSAAHCVDGASATILRVRAGVHARDNSPNAQIIPLASYKMHEQYNNGQATYANDIAILTFATNALLGGNVQVANLPEDNNNDFAGSNCVITGWGRTSSANTLPNILQQADVTILSTSQCSLQGVGANIWSGHICIRDPNNSAGACNGDSGGPANCPAGGRTVVAGIASFVFAANNNCLTNRPSVYTRVSTYLQWITDNTPPSI